MGCAGIVNLEALSGKVHPCQFDRCRAEVESRVVAQDAPVEHHLGELGGTTPDLKYSCALRHALADRLPHWEVSRVGVVNRVLGCRTAVDLVVPTCGCATLSHQPPFAPLPDLSRDYVLGAVEHDFLPGLVSMCALYDDRPAVARVPAKSCFSRSAAVRQVCVGCGRDVGSLRRCW